MCASSRHTHDTTWPPPCIFLLQVAQRAHGLQPRCRINLLLRDLSDDGAQNPPLAARPACCVAIPRLLLARALCPMFLEAQRAILTRCPPYELTCACSSAGWEASRSLNGRRSIVAIAPHNYIRSTHPLALLPLALLPLGLHCGSRYCGSHYFFSLYYRSLYHRSAALQLARFAVTHYTVRCLAPRSACSRPLPRSLRCLARTAAARAVQAA